MIDITELYKTQISLSEWFEKASLSLTENFRSEDNEKRERLKVLNKVAGTPFDQPAQFRAEDLSKKTAVFRDYLEKHGKELCALRLIPQDLNLPKLRMRGQTVKNVMKWFDEQKIDPLKYRAEFIPHSDNPVLSTIFVVNKKGVFGEVIAGGHYQLTQGFHDSGKPIAFKGDFKGNVYLSAENSNIVTELKKIIKYLMVVDKNKKKILEKEPGCEFYENYILGYFETITTKEFGLWFIDYNRVLGRMYERFELDFTSSTNKGGIKGTTASRGIGQGKVRFIPINLLKEIEFSEGEVLVCEMTTPDYLPLMKKASAIVTKSGGILSHAAILSREMGKPCIVGIGESISMLSEGDLVKVNANIGIVEVLR